jgi:hypothetical protein
MPQDEALLDVAITGEGGTYEQFPKRAVKMSFLNQKPKVGLINNYNEIYSFDHWQRFQDAFPNDPAITDPRIRRLVRYQISSSGWKQEIQKQDGTFWTFSGNWPQNLSFTRGVIRWEHHSYNATKDGIFG